VLQIVPASYAAAAYLESVNFKATGKKVLCLANSGVEEVSIGTADLFSINEDKQVLCPGSDTAPDNVTATH